MRIPGFLFAPRPSSRRLPRFLALTDMKRAPDPFAMLAHLPKSCGLVWRAYEGNVSRARLEDLARACRRSRVPLFLATPDIRQAPSPLVHLHLPERHLNRPYTDGIFDSGRHMRQEIIITAAAHSERAIVAAARAGVDAVLISPVFPTLSHPGNPTLGVTRFAALAHLARSMNLAVYALGGVSDPSKMRRLSQSGATGIAAIELFLPVCQA